MSKVIQNFWPCPGGLNVGYSWPGVFLLGASGRTGRFFTQLLFHNPHSHNFLKPKNRGLIDITYSTIIQLPNIVRWLKIFRYMQGYLVFHTSKSLAGFNIELRETLEMFKTYDIFQHFKGLLLNSSRFPKILFGIYLRKWINF